MVGTLPWKRFWLKCIKEILEENMCLGIRFKLVLCLSVIYFKFWSVYTGFFVIIDRKIRPQPPGSEKTRNTSAVDGGLQNENTSSHVWESAITLQLTNWSYHYDVHEWWRNKAFLEAQEKDIQNDWFLHNWNPSYLAWT